MSRHHAAEETSLLGVTNKLLAELERELVDVGLTSKVEVRRREEPRERYESEVNIWLTQRDNPLNLVDVIAFTMFRSGKRIVSPRELAVWLRRELVLILQSKRTGAVTMLDKHIRKNPGNDIG